MNRTIILIGGFILVVASSCKVKQAYTRLPDTAGKLSYRDTAENNGRSKIITDTTTIASIPLQKIFGDTVLKALIREGIKNNFDLKIAVARIKEAQANFTQSKSALFPSLSGNVGSTYQRPNSTTGTYKHEYEAYLSTSWDVDLWGKLSSAKRSELALLLESDAYKKAVQTELVASIAGNYYQLMAYDKQLKVTIATVKNRREDVRVTKLLKESDVLTGAAVVQSQANVFSAAVTIPDLKEDIRETENALCILLAREPGPIKRDSLDNQELDTTLSAGLPMQLLSNRPDVQEAEFQLRSDAELVNVARAYFYPSLTITAEGGVSSTKLSNLFNVSSILGNIIGGLTQPIFNNGLNKQRLEVAKAVQEQDFYTFKKTLLTAIQQVSDALYKYKAAEDKVSIRSQEIFFLQKSVDYTIKLMKYNENTNYTDVLTSEQNLLAAQLNAIADKLQQLQAVVTLYTSLGGGWK